MKQHEISEIMISGQNLKTFTLEFLYVAIATRVTYFWLCHAKAGVSGSLQQ